MAHEDSLGLGCAEEGFVYGVGREVVVALDDNRLVGLCENDAVDGCPNHVSC